MAATAYVWSKSGSCANTAITAFACLFLLAFDWKVAELNAKASVSNHGDRKADELGGVRKAGSCKTDTPRDRKMG